jgi:hypothetical protein
MWSGVVNAMCRPRGGELLRAPPRGTAAVKGWQELPGGGQGEELTLGSTSVNTRFSTSFPSGSSNG